MAATAVAHGNLCVSIKKYEYVLPQRGGMGLSPGKTPPGAVKCGAPRQDSQKRTQAASSLSYAACSCRRRIGGKASAMAAAPNPTRDEPMKSQE